MKYLIVGKENFESDLEKHIQFLKDGGLNDFTRHLDIMKSGEIPEWYNKYTKWFELMIRFNNPFDYFEHEKAEIVKRYNFKKSRGDYNKYVHLGYSKKKNSPKLLSQYRNQNYLDVRIVTETEFKKLNGKKT